MKKQKKPWSELKENKCPRCGSGLTSDLFGNNLLGCSCSFDITKEAKDTLTQRDEQQI